MKDKEEKIKYLDKSLLDDIDKILTSIYENGNSRKVSVKDKTKNVAVALKLIQEKERLTFYLDENGVLALQDGGIKNYLYKLRIDKDLDGTIKQLTSKRLKYDLLYSGILVVFGAIIGYVPTLVNEDKMTKEVILLRKSITDKTLQDDNFQKRLYDMNKQVLYLRSEIDSLKNTSEKN